MRRRLRLLVPLLACAAALTHAPVALGHAQLLGSSPLPGSTVARQPAEVIFKFGEAVGGTLGAVRVYDAQGNEVDAEDVTHPDARPRWIGVGLKPSLPDGTYTATYRVISADTHIVYGGLVFNLGHPGTPPRITVGGLIARNRSGVVTDVAAGVVRWLDYLSIALLLGGLAFLLVAWRPALATLAEADPGWRAASNAFTARLTRLLAATTALGVAASLLGILLQGASAAGVSLWSSLKIAIVRSTLDGRFGTVWGLRAVDWLVLGGTLALLRTHTRRYSSSARASSRRGRPLGSPPAPRWLLGLLFIASAYLAFTPALAGHASVQSPSGLSVACDVLHVLAASVWVGGIACLLIVVPAATRRLPGGERTRLLLAVLLRFSPLALTAVFAIATTGVVQAYIDVRSLSGLVRTTYGALILAKVGLLLALIGIGWINRRRVIPSLRRLADGRPHPGGATGRAGVLARRTLRGELALMLGVFGVTAALIGYAPPIDAASGPFALDTTIGPAELEMTLEPARLGANVIHIYLINAADGSQFTATKELTVTASLPAKGIGPLPLQATVAGPGHYVLSSAELSPAGTWQIEVTDRVSEFHEYTRTVKVPIQ